MSQTTCRASQRAGLAVVLAVVANLLFAASSLAQGIGGYSVQPGSSSPTDPATRSYFKPVVPAGGSFSDHVLVTNTGSARIELRAYAVDGLTGQTTGTVYANRQDRVSKAGAWLRLGVRRITVAPHAKVAVPFTVQVPRRAAPGDHVAGVAFENVHPRKSGGRFQITQIIREVVGVQVRVPGRAFAQPSLGSMALKALPGTTLPSLLVGVGNRGRTLCKPQLAVALRGPGGSRRVVQALDTVLPGEAVRYPMHWPVTLRSGRYAARASATCNGRRATRNATLNLAKTLPKGGRDSSSHAAGGVPLWVLVAVAVGGVVLGVGSSRLRSSKQAKAGSSTDDSPGPGTSDDSQPAVPAEAPRG